MATPEIKCPKCGSNQFTANKKGFSVGKAVVGDILVGPVGLLGGTLGSDKVIITCLNCGQTFKPGDALKAEQQRQVNADSAEFYKGNPGCSKAVTIVAVALFIGFWYLWGKLCGWF